LTITRREANLCNTAVKLLAWLENFKEVSTAVVNYDPHHYALPGAGVRLLLEVCVNAVLMCV
jgi:hypothetical protein